MPKSTRKKAKHLTEIEVRFEDEKKPQVITVKREVDGREEQGKTISIDKLPECQHKTRLLNVVKDSSSKVCVVAMRFQTGTWQAYIGYPDIRDLKPTVRDFDIEWHCQYIRDVQQVKMLGEVLTKDIATQLFPDWDARMYQQT